MATWWNTEYPIRRNVKFLPSTELPVLAGYPLFVTYNYSSLLAANKIRSDLADIEVLHLNSNDTWTVVPKNVAISGNNLVVTFNALENITTINQKYYIHMGNIPLRNKPTVAAYTPANYVISTNSGGVGLSFTKPTEEWKDGVSQKVNAKANFGFYGVDARLVVKKGPNRGILELRVDNGSPILIDTYAKTATDAVVYTSSGLTLGRHNFRIRATGDKSNAASDSAIEIEKWEYSRYTQGVDMGEEINSSLSTIRIVVGP